ncbi:hypothetical protein BVY04_03230 [bacterium M21]|nr:hypothetical protein BVY04_03230 [bacterium M21]
MARKAYRERQKREDGEFLERERERVARVRHRKKLKVRKEEIIAVDRSMRVLSEVVVGLVSHLHGEDDGEVTEHAWRRLQGLGREQREMPEEIFEFF